MITFQPVKKYPRFTEPEDRPPCPVHPNLWKLYCIFSAKIQVYTRSRRSLSSQPYGGTMLCVQRDLRYFNFASHHTLKTETIISWWWRNNLHHYLMMIRPEWYFREPNIIEESFWKTGEPIRKAFVLHRVPSSIVGWGMQYPEWLVS
jgi:hypothetical protein